MTSTAQRLSWLMVAVGLGLAQAEPLVLTPQIDDRDVEPAERTVDLSKLDAEGAQVLSAKLVTRHYGAGYPKHNNLTFLTDQATPGMFAVDVAKASRGGAVWVVKVGETEYGYNWPGADATHQVKTIFSVPVPAGKQQIQIRMQSGVIVVNRYLWLAAPADAEGLQLTALPELPDGPGVPVALIHDEPFQADGYLGDWFDLGQKTAYGSKYSGGLATYTAKHRPTAVYDPAVKRTFFVYGGQDQPTGDLQVMAAYYDHTSGLVPRPTRVLRWDHYNDPHCNGSIAIDDDGYIWVFVSGRGRARAGYKYRSLEPHSAAGFQQMSVEEMAYPQSWYLPGQGFCHLFTKYTAGRELYWETSDPSGTKWSEDHKLVGFGGHYQASAVHDGTIVTAFNYHPGGSVDKRTNLYVCQTKDLGRTWTTMDGRPLKLPLDSRDNPALVLDYEQQGLLCYLKDLNFDAAGNPMILHEVSHHYAPGPKGDPRTWRVARWTGSEWVTSDITTSDHNYDMGSLWLERDQWRVIGPTEKGPQPYQTGGEIAVWTSADAGRTWTRDRQVTKNSPRNHGYVRRPVDAQDPFYAFWADGDPTQKSPVRLYFCNRDGSELYLLPEKMEGETARPERLR